MKGWIGVDLDGTLANDEKWLGLTVVGDPIEPMVSRVRAWLADSRDVRIFTARVSYEPMRERVIEAIDAWCIENFGEALPVTNIKDGEMSELWDDRAVGVVRNTGAIKGGG